MSEENEEDTNHSDERAIRFDYLMQRYLDGEASQQENQELRSLVENGWGTRFQNWIDEELKKESEGKPLPTSVRKEILDNILGDVKQETVPLKPTRWWNWVAAAVVVIGTVLWIAISDRESQSALLTDGQTKETSQDLIRLTGKQFLYLPDGSSVLMNEGSELTYSPGDFEKGHREVTLVGEAFFDIESKPGSLFQVIAGEVVTKVLGTAFNINRHAEKIVVTVTRGRVEVSGRRGVYGQLKPDQRLTVNPVTNEYKSDDVRASDEVAWKNAYLIFDNVDLQQASELIRNHYGVELSFSNPEVVGCRVTASFLNGEDLNTVLTILSEMMGGSYRIHGRQAQINGGSCQ